MDTACAKSTFHAKERRVLQKSWHGFCFPERPGCVHYDCPVNTNLLYDALHSGPKGFEVFAEDILKALKELKVPPAAAGGGRGL